MWKSSTEISNSIFYPLKNWAEETSGNWNMLVGSGFVLVLLGVLLLYVYIKRIGKADERTNQIYLNSASIMLCGVVLFDLIFPKEYMWQIFFLFKYAFVFIAAGIYLAVRYKKELS
ncbi:DUF2178 domain-containing protein [Planococcus sp. N028]|uniref:DUF2178 domain-containing protein n=1 Tax=Planococcus shixiaomingii TaxID=3058393 RepID=A0ABT8N3T3_9BACL|nr:DUF2178 domain-containing protein [Planococcus sp. N028]MDN7242537.1 DUF2178 domain-containing protein [Planococcus sp. N028]